MELLIHDDLVDGREMIVAIVAIGKRGAEAETSENGELSKQGWRDCRRSPVMTGSPCGGGDVNKGRTDRGC
ncbi:hypothetical protein AXF42_Ash017445 [Apostasia shenzhenica]|uniref:Uncharacterized protein n=1 Tax=Apostasia shenzhenica TaxID=1088818 RepID=A0A2H9ZZ40_9ASPA|nr:hypothetical protein AXF42_Ash017445 [Apostasia shenzhenica]